MALTYAGSGTRGCLSACPPRSATGLLSADEPDKWSLPAALLIGGLLAELLARRRNTAPVRAAVPVRREPTDLVPRWALGLHAAAVLITLLALGGALAGVGWARQWYSLWNERALWAAFVTAVLTVAAVWTVIALALRRPPVAELRIDPLLRARGARVPVGLGTAALCALLSGGHSAVIGVAGLVIWAAIANPVRGPVLA